ncbi:MAG: replication-relaxation family protein [Bdellovibrionales bacterium]|nr:replication-relaxation family protein [Bdellovibrionales bacterium]
MVRVQYRDRELIHGLSKFGILSSKQIATWFFKNVDRHTVLRRLRILEKHKLILNSSTLPNGTKTWSLTKDGAAFLNLPEPFRYTNRNTSLHDVTLAGLRKHFEASGLAWDWTSDIELKRKLPTSSLSTYKVPDGLFIAEIESQKSVVALELELHPKAHRKYDEIFKEYHYRPAISHLLYIVRHSSIMKPLTTCWQRSRQISSRPRRQYLIFALLDDIKNDLQSSKIYFPNKTSVPLNKFFHLTSTCPSQNHSIAHPLGNRSAESLSTLESR